MQRGIFCKGTCGRIFAAIANNYERTDCIVLHHFEYRDGFCRECYIEKLEKELDKLRKTWINPGATIY